MKWAARVQDVYTSLEELIAHDRIFDDAHICGYDSPEAMWAENPIIGGSGVDAAAMRIEESQSDAV